MKPESWASKVNRVTNDPRRIEKRKGLVAALTVPRHAGPVIPMLSNRSNDD